MGAKKELSSVEKEICEKYNLNNHVFDNMHIQDISEVKIKVQLKTKNVVDKNMQVSGNDFEGWVFALRMLYVREIVLDIDDVESIPKGYINNGHWCRFLYRAMKFEEQYNCWFSLSNDLKIIVTKFKDFLNGNTFVNNIPTKIASDTWKNADENAFESKFATSGLLKNILETKDFSIGEGKVNRQLPVGLFLKEKSKDNVVFSCGKSAIDLWNIK